MKNNAEVRVERVLNTLKIHISGVLDEEFKSEKFPLVNSMRIEFYLGKVSNINSIAIREWIRWLNTAPNATFEFNECPRVIIDQINTIKGFLPKTGTVKSFYVPYYCDETGDEKNVLFTAGKEYVDSTINLPIVKTDSGKPMEVDIVLSNYFKFLLKKS